MRTTISTTRIVCNCCNKTITDPLMDGKISSAPTYLTFKDIDLCLTCVKIIFTNLLARQKISEKEFREIIDDIKNIPRGGFLC